MRGKPCDDCGADGDALACICEPEETHDKAKPTQARQVDTTNKPPRSHVSVQRVQDAVGRLGTQSRAPQSFDYTGQKVICCRCKHVHNEGDRLNEWGTRAGKVMAGRRTECPNGCGYHVTIPYVPEVHGLPND